MSPDALVGLAVLHTAAGWTLRAQVADGGVLDLGSHASRREAGEALLLAVSVVAADQRLIEALGRGGPPAVVGLN